MTGPIVSDPLYGKLGQIVVTTRQMLSKRDEKSAMLEIKADVKTVGAQTNEARLGGDIPGTTQQVYFTVYSDEREMMKNSPDEVKGPYPLEYFMASIGFCELTMYGRWAAYLGLDIDEVQMSLSGVFDMRGLYGLENYDPAFKEIQIDTHIKGRLAEEQIKELVRWVHRCCPMFNTVKKAVKITENIYYNGKQVESITVSPTST